MNNNKNFSEILLGIANIGNTCYINSLTQCLIHTEPFRNLILDKNNINKLNYNILKNDNKLIKDDKIDITELCLKLNDKLSYHLIKLITNYINNKPINPKKYVMKICDNDIFELGEQADCHELYIFIINKLKEELKDDVNINLDENILEIYNNILDEDIKNKLENLKKMLNNDFSSVATPFMSISDTIINCNCNYETHSFDTPLQLELNLVGDDKIIKLEDCIEDHYNKITCEDYKCSKCNTTIEINKQEYIWLAPQILVIHLKRFITSYENKIYKQTKIHTFVQYNEIIDMSKYMTNKKREYKYELYAISNHFGSLNGGHYYSYIKKNNYWYRFDDNKIFELDNEEHLNNKYAYLLFYKLIKNE